MFKQKKSEIQNRAKRLLTAFASETRKHTAVYGQRKLIRAQYEKGMLRLKEDFVKLPYAQITNKAVAANPNQLASLVEKPPKAIQILFPKAQEHPVSNPDAPQPTGKEKLHLVLSEIVQMYSLQFKIVDELMGILKGELQKF